MLRVFPFAPKTPTIPRPTEERPSCEPMLAAATPALYLENPFRRFGLSAIATPREISRRVDELKLSLELGTISMPWAFAPEREPTVAEIRASAQKLKSPRDRLICEFFWFWPETYPADGPDEALAALARGETVPALDLWLAAAETGSAIARHNLAVYLHVLALDWEQNPEAEATRLPEVWPQALGNWQRLADDEALWTTLSHRVRQLADPQLPASFVTEMRASLPAAIARINATLLITDAEHGRTGRVALHASLIKLIHRDAAGVRRTLEASAAPLAGRVDRFVAAARRDVNDESLPALSVGLTLIQNCDADLRLFETLCGGEEAYTELTSSVADVALTCLVAHQRRSDEDQPCLTPLVYLLNMPVTPEVRRRLEETFDVIRGNIASPSAGEDSELARDHRMIVETIIPGLDTLQLSPAGRFQFTSRLAEWLEALANAALSEAEQLELAAAVLSTALTLSCEPTVRERLEARWAEVEPEVLRRKYSVQLERAGHVVLIDSSGINFDGQPFAPAIITGARHGRTPEGGWVFAWCAGEEVVVLDATNVLAEETAADDYAALVAAFNYFVAPQLAAGLLEAIRQDATIFIGETPLSRAGMGLADTPLASPEDLVPYARVEHQIADDFLLLKNLESPSSPRSHSLSEVWNAVIAGSVIDALARDANPVLT